MTPDRESLVRGIWSCIALLHRSGKLPEPTVELLLEFGREDQVTQEEAVAVVAEKERAA